MSDPVCQLDDFHFRQLSVEWHDPETSGQVEINHTFDYEVGQHSTEHSRFRLALQYKTVSATPQPVGYAVQAEIVGFFRFPDGMEQEKMDYLIRLNGCTILYGILRGQIANLTGVFPRRKLVLPTFMMKDVVEAVEISKAEKRDKNIRLHPPKKKTSKVQ
jgi:preprotein translocase subunit SecB